VLTKKELIRALACSLVKNHIQHISLKQPYIEEIVSDIFIEDTLKSRVIVVVGAGASNPAGVLLSDEARHLLIKKQIMPNKMLEAELDRISLVYGLQRDLFETTLLALNSNEYTANILKDNLQEIYGHRFIPTLCYEILAHMFKHRFVDAIINFNFDELLDQAIEDELESDEYYYILSDGDCPDDLNTINDKLDRPFYIKPHGTVSYKSTLRFTREHYFHVPAEISRIIGDLVNIDIPLVILAIGFAMQSFEFNNILRRNVKDISKIYYINLDEVEHDSNLSKILCSELIRVNRDNNSLNEIMEDIWKEITLLFKTHIPENF